MSLKVTNSRKRGLCLLSIDSGGIRTLSTLITLKEILHRLQQTQNLPELPLPCDVFHLAGGTGTGGIVVIMLFRLRMSIDAAISAYVRLAEYVFSVKKWQFQDGTFKASRLEDAILDIIERQLQTGKDEAKNLRMLDPDGSKCFVSAMPAGNMSFPTLFRTWIPSENPSHNCTIVQATRATMAVPTLFKSIEIGEPIKQSYIDGGFGCSNPVRYVVQEARSLFADKPISCVLSLGTGAENVIGLHRPDAFQKILPMNLISVLKSIATDCEKVSEEMASQLSNMQDLYYVRLNVDQGLQGVSLAEWQMLGLVTTHTVQYLQKYEVKRKVSQLVAVLRGPQVNTSSPPTNLSREERDAFAELKMSVAVSAYHDSQERAAATECQVGTRTHEIAAIMKWIDGDDKSKPFFVVLGPAGSGKTSLLGSIARLCKEKKIHAASFFFQRTENERNNAERLVNTIVYQIAIAIPELQPYIATAIKGDSTILSRALETRMDSLLIQPLSQLISDYPQFNFSPRVIIIDALDECGTYKNQLQVLSMLSNVFSKGSLPFLCFISNRFDPHGVDSMFSREPTQHLVFDRIILGSAVPSEMADIRAYLEASVDEIRRNHRFSLRIPPDWPSESDLVTVVQRSGGQFIYAATVIRYLESPHHEPHERLKTALGVLPVKLGIGPFVVLDGIYQTLFASVEDVSAILEILGIELVRSNTEFWTPESLEPLPQLRPYDRTIFKSHFDSFKADIVLAPLAPVLKSENSVIKFHHLSFAEFLLDRVRSREFFIDLTRWQKWLVAQLVPYFFNDPIPVFAQDVEYLMKEATPGTILHQAIEMGYELVASHPDRIPASGDYNIWPFVTRSFFFRLQSEISVNNVAIVFSQRGDDYLPLSVLVQFAEYGASNSFLLFELCRMVAGLKKVGFIRERRTRVTSKFLLLCMTYLAAFVENQRRLEENILTPRDYLSAAIRCLWYLQKPRHKVRASLTEQLLSSLEHLPFQFGIISYLEENTTTTNLARGALQVFPYLLSRCPPSQGFLSALKHPFDNEVTSRTPASSRKARNMIHEYLMEHDKGYREGPSHYLLVDPERASFADDETDQEFYSFLRFSKN